jgi:hypothetical protein
MAHRHHPTAGDQRRWPADGLAQQPLQLLAVLWLQQRHGLDDAAVRAKVQSSRWQPYSQSRPSGDRAHIRAPSRSRSMSICSCQPLARSSRIRPHQISPQGLSARKASPARTASKACWISAAQQRLRGNRAGDASHCHGTRAPTPQGRSGCRNSGSGRDGARESAEIRRFRLPSCGVAPAWAGQRDGER